MRLRGAGVPRDAQLIVFFNFFPPPRFFFRARPLFFICTCEKEREEKIISSLNH